MRFYSAAECEKWLQDRDRQKPDAIAGMPVESIAFPPAASRFLFFAQWISTSLTFRMPALLWITAWGIWGPGNSHLYYKLRQSYGDMRLLDEAPGHQFLEHESEDLASFLQLSLLNGWGGYLLTEANYVNVFFSHDEYLDFYGKDYDLSEIRKGLAVESASPETAG
jgi:hypothetical protein